MAKVMISLPDELLEIVDAEAAARGTSRSALLALAARREVYKPDAARIDLLLEQARTALADSGNWSATELVHDERVGH